MRREAQAAVEALIRELDLSSASTSQATAAGGNGSISTAMKAKLRNAVTAMQEGLVERDTEVRRPGQRVRARGAAPCRQHRKGPLCAPCACRCGCCCLQP